MAGKLTKSPSTAPLAERRLSPTIDTAARPEADDLIHARAEITRNTRLRKIFMAAKDEQRPPEEVADVVASALTDLWGQEKATAAYEAALYLADEHAQLEPGVCVVSQKTGKVLAVLRPEDIETPAPVPREGSGKLAQPLPRIRPDIEAFITSWEFDFEREQQVCAELVRRGHQTEFLREAGDPRLLVVTREGRREIARRYAGYTPKELLGTLGGSSWAFLRHLDIGDLVPEEENARHLLGGTAVGRATTPIQDIRAFNMRYDVPTGIRTSLSNGWVREIARLLAGTMEKAYANMDPVHVDLLGPEHFGDKALFWITPPELARHVLQAKPGVTALVVEGVPLVGFEHAKVGKLLVPDEFEVESRELFDKWTVFSRLRFVLDIQWGRLKYIPVTGIAYKGIVTTRPQ